MERGDGKVRRVGAGKASSRLTGFQTFLTTNHYALTTGLRALLATNHYALTTGFGASLTTNHYPLPTAFSPHPPPSSHPTPPSIQTHPPIRFCETVKLWNCGVFGINSLRPQVHSFTVSQFCFSVGFDF